MSDEYEKKYLAKGVDEVLAAKDAELAAARALLVETQELCESVRMLPLPVGAHAEALLVRIKAMLEKKP